MDVSCFHCFRHGQKLRMKVFSSDCMITFHLGNSDQRQKLFLVTDADILLEIFLLVNIDLNIMSLKFNSFDM